MKRFKFCLVALLSLLLISSCDNGDSDSPFNPADPGIEEGTDNPNSIDINNVYGGWISELSKSDFFIDYLYSIYVNRDLTIEGYWYEGIDDYGLDEYSHFTGRAYISDNNMIIVANFSDEDEEAETWDNITILQLSSSILKIEQDEFQISFSKTSNITPPNAISQNNIYGEWKGKAPADDDEYLESITINRDNSITGRWYEGDNEYSQFGGTIVVEGKNVTINFVFFDENGNSDEEETSDELTLVELTENTLVIREAGEEDQGELFSYYNYCMYKPGGENLLPQPGDVYMFTSALPRVKSTSLTYISSNKYGCSNSGGSYYIDIEAILTKLTGGTFTYSGDIGNYSARLLNSNGFTSLVWDMGAWNRYNIVVDPNFSSYSRTQQIEIEYSYYYNKQVSGTAIITIEQEAYQSSSGGSSGSGTGGSSTQIVTGKVSAIVDVIGPGLSYDSYAQYIDGKTCTIEYTYNPSTGEYYIYAGPYSSNPDANGGKGLRHKAQKGSNSITIMQDFWLEYRPNSVVPIKYNWEARLKFTLP